MASKEEEGESPLPIVLIQRAPSFNVPLTDHLQPYFRLIDSPSLLLSKHGQSVRALLCVGPAVVNSDLLSLLPSLELVVATGAGVDRIDLWECQRKGVTVTNASSAFADDAADYAVGLLLHVLRGISGSDRFVRNGSWVLLGDYPLGFKVIGQTKKAKTFVPQNVLPLVKLAGESLKEIAQLGGKRVGIIGFGHIGSEVAKRLVAFGCNIAYNSRKKKHSVPFPFYSNARNLAADSDVLILCCSLTQETRHVINKEVLTALGKGGVIINIGRGALIDEKELVQSLLRGEIGGAGLDVFENEPEVPKEFLLLDNVVLSPHQAAVTPEALEALKELTLANLKAFFSNQPLQSIVHIE